MQQLVLALHADMVIILVFLVTLWKQSLRAPTIGRQIFSTLVVAVSMEEQEEQHLQNVTTSLIFHEELDSIMGAGTVYLTVTLVLVLIIIIQAVLLGLMVDGPRGEEEATGTLIQVVEEGRTIIAGDKEQITIDILA
jgi:hypothetical protein